MNKNWKKYIKKEFKSDKELTTALLKCGIPKRINFKEHPLDTMKAYPIFKEAGNWHEGDCLGKGKTGGYFYNQNSTWTMTIERSNEILGRDYMKKGMKATSFLANVLLDILLRTEATK